MCLTVTPENYSKNIFQKIFGIQPKIKPLIAKKDIICYKAYIKTDMVGVVKSPFQKTLNLVGKSVTGLSSLFWLATTLPVSKSSE